MRKALILSPFFPNKNGNGPEKRVHQWVTKLAQEYEIHLLVISEERKNVEGVHHLQIISSRVENQFNRMPRLFQKVKTFLTAGWLLCEEEQQMILKEMYQNCTFDYILCFRLHIKEYALYLQKLTQCSYMELDLDDLESMTRKKIGLLAFKRKRYKLALSYLMSSIVFKKQERHIEGFFQKLYVCSLDDQKLLYDMFPKYQIDVMPNRFYSHSPLASISNNTHQILFVGTLGYYPNEEAIEWFVKKVFPILKAQNPKWTLHIAGVGENERLKQLLFNIKGIIYHGYVKDLSDIYSQASFVISPLHAGGGTKLKILEAMQYGRPIIATYESVHGLNVVDQVHYLQAETVDEFVQACNQLAEDADLCHSLVERSRQVVIE